jgi:hypothetical protein
VFFTSQKFQPLTSTKLHIHRDEEQDRERRERMRIGERRGKENRAAGNKYIHRREILNKG